MDDYLLSKEYALPQFEAIIENFVAAGGSRNNKRNAGSPKSQQKESGAVHSKMSKN